MLRPNRLPAALLTLIMVLGQVLFSGQPAAAISVTDFFTLSYQIRLSVSEVTEGQAFSALCSGSAECKTTLPITSATITSRVIAQPQAGGSTVILNPNYQVVIAPFPGQAGQSTQITKEVQLAFPPGSAYGMYTVTGELLDATIQTTIGPVSVKSFLPQTQSMGSVNFKAAAPGGGGDGGQTPTVYNVGEPKVTVASGFINEGTGVFVSRLVARSGDGKCLVGIDAGVRGLDSQGNPLSHVAVTASAASSAPPAGATLLGTPYDLAPNGATFDPPITVSFAFDVAEGITADQLRLALLDPSTGVWTPVGGATIDTGRTAVSSQISHFSTYAVLVYTNPARFTIRDLLITPAQVRPGQDVTISAVIANTGGLSGGYTVTAKVDGQSVGTAAKTMAPDETQPVSFTVKSDPGTHTVELNGLTGSFKVLAPATFQVSRLSVSPASVTVNAEVTVSATVNNTGDLPGTYEAVLKIDGATVASKQLNVVAQGQEQLTLKIPADKTGIHSVTLGAASASLTVQASPTPTPSPTPSPTPTPAPAPAPSPSAPPPSASTPAPSQAPSSSGGNRCGGGDFSWGIPVFLFLLLRRRTAGTRTG